MTGDYRKDYLLLAIGFAVAVFCHAVNRISERNKARLNANGTRSHWTERIMTWTSNCRHCGLTWESNGLLDGRAVHDWHWDMGECPAPRRNVTITSWMNGDFDANAHAITLDTEDQYERFVMGCSCGFTTARTRYTAVMEEWRAHTGEVFVDAAHRPIIVEEQAA